MTQSSSASKNSSLRCAAWGLALLCRKIWSSECYNYRLQIFLDVTGNGQVPIHDDQVMPRFSEILPHIITLDPPLIKFHYANLGIAFTSSPQQHPSGIEQQNYDSFGRGSKTIFCVSISVVAEPIADGFLGWGGLRMGPRKGHQKYNLASRRWRSMVCLPTGCPWVRMMVAIVWLADWNLFLWWDQHTNQLCHHTGTSGMRLVFKTFCLPFIWINHTFRSKMLKNLATHMLAQPAFSIPCVLAHFDGKSLGMVKKNAMQKTKCCHCSFNNTDQAQLGYSKLTYDGNLQFVSTWASNLNCFAGFNFLWDMLQFYYEIYKYTNIWNSFCNKNDHPSTYFIMPGLSQHFLEAQQYAISNLYSWPKTLLQESCVILHFSQHSKIAYMLKFLFWLPLDARITQTLHPNFSATQQPLSACRKFWKSLARISLYYWIGYRILYCLHEWRQRLWRKGYICMVGFRASCDSLLSGDGKVQQWYRIQDNTGFKAVTGPVWPQKLPWKSLGIHCIT